MKRTLTGYLIKKKVPHANNQRWIAIETVRNLDQAQYYIFGESGKFKFVPQYRRV